MEYDIPGVSGLHYEGIMPSLWAVYGVHKHALIGSFAIFVFLPSNTTEFHF